MAPPTNPKYQPPAREGWVFWSNFGAALVLEPTKDVTREFAQHSVASTFDIPLKDVLVEPFHPDGPPTTPYHTAWAAYVREKHAAAVNAKRDYCRLMCDLLFDEAVGE